MSDAAVVPLHVVDGADTASRQGKLMELPVDSLFIGDDFRLDDDLDDLNELAASIREHGIWQPLLVRQIEVDRWEVVAGRRRLAAARMADCQTVPCILRDLSDEEAYDAALDENLHRRNLSPIEEALAYDRLKREKGLSQAAIAKRVGRSQTHVSTLLRLLELPASVRAAIHQGRLSYATALRPKPRTGHRQGSNGNTPLQASEAVIVSHWHRRHDRLISGLRAILRADLKTPLDYRITVERLLKLDAKPLEEANEPKDWREDWRGLKRR